MGDLAPVPGAKGDHPERHLSQSQGQRNILGRHQKVNSAFLMRCVSDEALNNE